MAKTVRATELERPETVPVTSRPRSGWGTGVAATSPAENLTLWHRIQP